MGPLYVTIQHDTTRRCAHVVYSLGKSIPGEEEGCCLVMYGFANVVLMVTFLPELCV
jgi:hypothetical protein